jgi:hypothetical protein
LNHVCTRGSMCNFLHTMRPTMPAHPPTTPSPSSLQ